jgi:hypothetical protein
MPLNETLYILARAWRIAAMLSDSQPIYEIFSTVAWRLVHWALAWRTIHKTLGRTKISALKCKVDLKRDMIGAQSLGARLGNKVRCPFAPQLC